MARLRGSIKESIYKIKSIFRNTSATRKNWCLKGFVGCVLLFRALIFNSLPMVSINTETDIFLFITLKLKKKTWHWSSENVPVCSSFMIPLKSLFARTMSARRQKSIALAFSVRHKYSVEIVAVDVAFVSAPKITFIDDETHPSVGAGTHPLSARTAKAQSDYFPYHSHWWARARCRLARNKPNKVLFLQINSIWAAAFVTAAFLLGRRAESNFCIGSSLRTADSALAAPPFSLHASLKFQPNIKASALLSNKRHLLMGDVSGGSFFRPLMCESAIKSAEHILQRHQTFALERLQNASLSLCLLTIRLAPL